MRLAGGNASAFKADNEQIQHDEKCKDKDNKPNIGGGQMDAAQEHTHGYYDEQWHYGSDSGGGRHDKADEHYDQYRVSYGNSGRSDIETRPTNITVEMYLYNPQ